MRPDMVAKLKRIKKYLENGLSEKEFDKISEKHSVYSKTSLINMALKEFVDKYK